MRTFILILAAVFCFAGCGYKTPLALPKPAAQKPASAPAPVTPVPPTPAPEAK